MNYPYLPHTEEDIMLMLGSIGVRSLNELFSDIPDSLKLKSELNLPLSASELEVRKELSNLSRKNSNLDDFVSFLGAGAYDHYIPSAVAHIISRSEFYTSYTPYQAEISQGILQVFFEYQTMICELTRMDISNASMYDGATALTEAVLMTSNISSRRQVLLPDNLHPEYKEVVKTYTKNLSLMCKEIRSDNGVINLAHLQELCTDETLCVVIQQPNFFGCIENLREIEKIIHKSGAYFIVSVDPVSLGILVAPGECNADIVTGEGQSLGNNINFGGPYLGFFAVKNDFIRRIPGRIVGETTDKEGKRAFTLTLQTREQHIRREKATSNICSNEALCALASTVYLAILGKRGIKEVATQCL